MTKRQLLPVALLLVLATLLAACVPESDIERAAGDDADSESTLTPIPEEDLPELPDYDLRVGAVDLHRSAERVVAEITISAGANADLEFADTAEVEWSDGEITEALPLPDASTMIESRRSDPDGTLEPVAVHLSHVTRVIGSDPDAEITEDEIVTEWGSFPVLSIESGGRPPGWNLEFQAAGQRWVSGGQVYYEGGMRQIEGNDVSFTDDEFRPVSASLHFSRGFDDLRSLLPMTLEVEVRHAIPEATLEIEQ